MQWVYVVERHEEPRLPRPAVALDARAHRGQVGRLGQNQRDRIVVGFHGRCNMGMAGYSYYHF